MVSYADFKKMDIRIARIKSVHDHPRADKLLILKVDVGDGEKQVVAGLKGIFPAESLVGKHIVVLNNLEPAVFRGVESQAMLLAAQDGERIILLVPEQAAAPGSKVL